MAHLSNQAARDGKLFLVRSDEQEEPRALVVTTVCCEGALVATWRTAFTPELQARDPAAVEQLLAQQHLEVMDLLDEGAFDHAARQTPRVEISAIAEPADPAPRPLASGPTEEVLPLDVPAAPATPAGSIPHNHPAFAGIPMHDWQPDEGEPGLEVDAPPPVDAPAADADSPMAKAPLPPMPIPTPAPPTPRATSPAALHEGAASRTRPKRPSLPALPVVHLAEDQARELGDLPDGKRHR